MFLYSLLIYRSKRSRKIYCLLLFCILRYIGEVRGLDVLAKRILFFCCVVWVVWNSWSNPLNRSIYLSISWLRLIYQLIFLFLSFTFFLTFLPFISLLFFCITAILPSFSSFSKCSSKSNLQFGQFLLFFNHSLAHYRW